MTCTYETNPSNEITKVRTLIGDIDCSSPTFTDEAIRVNLEISCGDPLKAAGLLAQAHCLQLSRCVDITIDDVSEKHSQRASQWCAVAKSLLEQSSLCGSSGNAPMDFNIIGPCVTPKQFGIGMHDYNKMSDSCEQLGCGETSECD